MTKKLKHRLVIEVTFDQLVTETQAYHLVRRGIDTTNLNQRITRFHLMELPKIRNFQIKRWSKVLAYVLREKADA